MGTTPTEEDLLAVHDLVQQSELREIRYHEVSARLLDANKQREENESNVDISMDLAQRRDDKSFSIRLTCTARPFKGEIIAAVAAEYAMIDGTTPSPRVVMAFANEVAIMTLFPYVREAISTSAARVFPAQQVLLPVMERGQVGFELDVQD